MAVTTAGLTAYVGASPADSTFVAACLATATALVGSYVGSAVVPVAVVDNAILHVGSEVFYRRSAPSGISQFAADGASPVRVARDPMIAAYPLLRPFLGPGIA